MNIREAAFIGDVEALVKIVGDGVDVNEVNSINGWTPLHCAVKGGNKKAVEFLLSKGALGNTKNKEGKTPQEYAANQEIAAIFGISGTVVPSSPEKKHLQSPEHTTKTPGQSVPQQHSSVQLEMLLEDLRRVQLQQNTLLQQLLNQIHSPTSLGHHQEIIIRAKLEEDACFVEFPLSLKTYQNLHKQLQIHLLSPPSHSTTNTTNNDTGYPKLFNETKEISAIVKYPMKVLVRNDWDVNRLKNEEEIVVMVKKISRFLKS